MRNDTPTLKDWLIGTIIAAVIMGILFVCTAFTPQQQNFGGGLPNGITFTSPTITISSAGNGNGVVALSGNTSGTCNIVGSASSTTVSSQCANFNIGVSGSVGGILGLNGATNGTATLTAPGAASTATNPILSSNSFRVASGTQLEIGPDTGLSREAAGVIDIGNGTQADSSAFVSTGNHIMLTAPFTDANAVGLQVITGLSYALGTVAHNWSFHCSLTYSQATPSASDQFGVASLTTSPTNLHAWAHVVTTEGAAAVQTTGDSGNITNTTPTSIVTFTPVGTGVKQVEIDGSIETAGTTATTLQFYVTNGTAANVIVIARDSYCTIY